MCELEIGGRGCHHRGWQAPECEPRNKESPPMRHRFASLFLIVVVLAGLCGRFVPAVADGPTNKAEPRTAKVISDFTLDDARGEAVSLASFKDKKAIVVLFLGTECPINNAFLPHLAQLHKTYAARGVQFLGINANQQDTPERIRAHAQRYEIPFPVLKDNDSRVADLFGA